MSHSNTATPLQQEIEHTVETTTGHAFKGRVKLRGDDHAVLDSWFKIASMGRNPTQDAIVKDTGFEPSRVKRCLANPEVQRHMEEVGHGVVDVVQLAVALRVANALEEYTRRWQSGEMQFDDIPKPFQSLAMEAYKSKIPETRAKQDTAKASKGAEKEPAEFSNEALKLLDFTGK